MKLFSIIFTALFISGFVSVSYAEPIYTISNKLFQNDIHKGNIIIFLDKGQEHLEKSGFWTKATYGNYMRKSISMYELRYDECLNLTADQFNDLVIPVTAGIKTRINSYKPGNYKIRTSKITEGRYKRAIYEIISVSRPSEGCIDIEEWMAMKEHEHFTSETSVSYADEQSVYTITHSYALKDSIRLYGDPQRRPMRRKRPTNNYPTLRIFLDQGQEHLEEPGFWYKVLNLRLSTSGLYTRKSVNMYKLRHDECLNLTADQFSDLVILEGLDCAEDYGCQLRSRIPGNYELRYVPDRVWERKSPATSDVVVDHAHYYVTSESQPSEGCTDIEDWMETKEQEYFISSN